MRIVLMPQLIKRVLFKSEPAIMTRGLAILSVAYEF